MKRETCSECGGRVKFKPSPDGRYPALTLLCAPCMTDHIFEARRRLRSPRRAASESVGERTRRLGFFLGQAASTGDGHGTPWRGGR